MLYLCPRFEKDRCRGGKTLSEFPFGLLPGMQCGKPDSVWISAWYAMKTLAFKSSYPGGVNDALIRGKPSPGGNFMPEIRLGLSPGGVNHARNPRQGFTRWEFYVQNPVHTLPRWE